MSLVARSILARSRGCRMISINGYLDGVLAGFQAYLEEGYPLCDLKSLNYDQGQIPDHKALHVQQYYLLRYAYGCAFEYKFMYRTVAGVVSIPEGDFGHLHRLWSHAGLLGVGPCIGAAGPSRHLRPVHRHRPDCLELSVPAAGS